MNAKLREAMLKAMCCGAECQYFGAGRSCRMHAQEEEERLYAVERVLSAAGYQIVPVEPTRTMEHAAVDATGLGRDMSWRNETPQSIFRKAYRAALLAAAKEDADGA